MKKICAPLILLFMFMYLNKGYYNYCLFKLRAGTLPLRPLNSSNQLQSNVSLQQETCNGINERCENSKSFTDAETIYTTFKTSDTNYIFADDFTAMPHDCFTPATRTAGY